MFVLIYIVINFYSFKKDDWNALARKNTLNSDPIGSKQQSIKRLGRRSLRRTIIEDASKGKIINDDKLLGMYIILHINTYINLLHIQIYYYRNCEKN